jgi:hypothetical protein
MGVGEEVLARITLTNVVLGRVAYALLKFAYQIVYSHIFHPLFSTISVNPCSAAHHKAHYPCSFRKLTEI